MSIHLNQGSEKYIEYGNEKLSKEFLRERIVELDDSLKNNDECDTLLTKKNLELNSRLIESCFNN
ncbi:hypothetical protein [Halobacteriovorax sp.]|uniref:hypothetical protein n=1 Tax=Halobacteriovorax sp. TaxID=2020862 RepID=UPI0035676442